jgi:hypothetical protein
VGHVACIGQDGKVYVLVGKADGQRPLGRLICTWMDEIKMNLQETGWEGVEWIHLAQDRDQW